MQNGACMSSCRQVRLLSKLCVRSLQLAVRGRDHRTSNHGNNRHAHKCQNDGPRQGLVPHGPLHGLLEDRGTASPNGLVLPEPLQVVGQILGAGIAIDGVFLHRFEDDGLQVVGYESIVFSGRLGLVQHDLPK